MGTYSIFLRDFANGGASQPHLLAYDIAGLREAQALVSGIARSYSEHGRRPGTGVHWFRHDGSVHEIYAWPEQ
jgi:hypothetical protein